MARAKSEYKYGVAKLAKELGILDASVRVGLRKAKIKKNKDGVYGWNSEKEFKSVANKLRTDTPAPKKSNKKSKPAKKSKLKVRGKKASAEADTGGSEE